MQKVSDKYLHKFYFPCGCACCTLLTSGSPAEQLTTLNPGSTQETKYETPKGTDPDRRR